MSDQAGGASLAPKPSRDELRKALFGEAKNRVKSEPFTLFGQQVELRRPNLGKLLEMQDQAQLDPKLSTLRSLVNCVYVPGTDEPVFTEADLPMISEMPFDDDARKLIETLGAMLNVTVATTEKNSDATNSA